jgi:hypothetical protein
MPLYEAGMRMEPPVSVPTATFTSRGCEQGEGGRRKRRKRTSSQSYAPMAAPEPAEEAPGSW